MLYFILSHQTTFIFIGTVIALLVAYFIKSEKYNKEIILVTGIIAALFGFIISSYQSKPTLYITANKFTGDGHQAILIRYDIMNSSLTKISGLNFSMIDFYGAFDTQFWKFKTFLTSFQSIPQHQTLKQAEENFNTNVSTDLKTIQPNTGEPAYITTIPLHEDIKRYGRAPHNEYGYQIVMKWDDGIVKIDIKFAIENDILVVKDYQVYRDNERVQDKDYFYYNFLG